MHRLLFATATLIFFLPSFSGCLFEEHSKDGNNPLPERPLLVREPWPNYGYDSTLSFFTRSTGNLSITNYVLSNYAEIDYNINFPVCGDINGDGKYEIIVTTRDTGELTNIYPQEIVVFDSTLRVLWRHNFTLGVPTKSVLHLGPPALCDLDGDGVLEITGSALLYEGIDLICGFVYALRGSGELMWMWQTDRSVYVVTPFDVNSDGKSELIVTGSAAPPKGKCGVYCISGNGALLWSWEGGGLSETSEIESQLPGIYMGTARPCVGDINGDGRPEIVTYYRIEEPNTCEITKHRYYGVACISYNGELLWNTTIRAARIAIGDIVSNGEDKLEVVASGTYENESKYNTTLLDCEGHIIWFSQYHLYSLSIVDMDGNGVSEIIGCVPVNVTELQNGLFSIESWGIIALEDLKLKWQANLSENLQFDGGSISIADFDNNGVKEGLLVLSYGYWDNEMFRVTAKMLLAIDSFGEIIWSHTLPSSIGNFYTSMISDLNCDGVVEIVTSGREDYLFNDKLSLCLFSCRSI